MATICASFFGIIEFNIEFDSCKFNFFVSKSVSLSMWHVDLIFCIFAQIVGTIIPLRLWDFGKKKYEIEFEQKKNSNSILQPLTQYYSSKFASVFSKFLYFI